MKALFLGLTAMLSLSVLNATIAGEAGTTDITADPVLAEKPGYVDFNALAADYGEPRVMINVGSSLLRLASVMDHRDPVAKAALSRMESVRIHVYDTHGRTEPAAQQMDELSALLKREAWEPIVRVREDDEQVDIFLKQDSERIHGITVMAVNGDEAVFINVLGDIDPAELGQVMDHVDIDVDLDL
jgi:hypothetical protein